ncbi:hypothetical protein G7Y89_g1101 [Cudoniella acicularis]|uniref:Uncharacterized protein n=1 Tax=Cudoniella acicularis TaxID=354080 RepID=A0A8H4RWY2_9HELO|nr:hypothetical protein G7Y89_g1101 [Cudoniella acicularis]
MIATDNVYIEAQKVGSTPALCNSTSNFETGYANCTSCVEENLGNPIVVTIKDYLTKFEPFLDYCANIINSSSGPEQQSLAASQTSQDSCFSSNNLDSGSNADAESYFRFCANFRGRLNYCISVGHHNRENRANTAKRGDACLKPHHWFYLRSSIPSGLALVLSSASSSEFQIILVATFDTVMETGKRDERPEVVCHPLIEMNHPSHQTGFEAEGPSWLLNGNPPDLPLFESELSEIPPFDIGQDMHQTIDPWFQDDFFSNGNLATVQGAFLDLNRSFEIQQNPRAITTTNPTNIEKAFEAKPCTYLGCSDTRLFKHSSEFNYIIVFYLKYLRLSQQEEQEDECTVRFLLEGLRGRDCQGISLDNPLDTTMMVVFNFGRSLEKQVYKYVSLRSNTAIKTVRSDLAKPFCYRLPLDETEYSRELEGRISRILETFDGKEDLTFSLT